MTENPQITVLQEEIRKTRAILDQQDDFYRSFLEGDYKRLGKSQTSAIIVAEVLTDVYTCLETLFLRISQYFENNLTSSRWHADLLQKMTLRLEGIREPVISDETYYLLNELLKFRHFRRYYFEFEYDWDKLDFLLKKYEQLRERISGELQAFDDFLENVKAEA